ncbi:wiskott-Aldrich syndrome protein homolog 1-like [Panicum virgatum]|uniref:wiskott-Aldrich syndrome protein homolog 1-like n=1 Tax=Panicum virgatum TaxID=38727 RepID=UPI0019D688E4|nr:wiskott-Aldrich syndrome protein homolog 1-like [Panicum virgatum]
MASAPALPELYPAAAAQALPGGGPSPPPCPTQRAPPRRGRIRRMPPCRHSTTVTEPQSPAPHRMRPSSPVPHPPHATSPPPRRTHGAPVAGIPPNAPLLTSATPATRHIAAAPTCRAAPPTAPQSLSHHPSRATSPALRPPCATSLEHMREKTLVTFRMAPKESKRQMSEKEATMADGWKKSKFLGPAPKQRQVVEERTPAAAAASSDVAESSRRAGGAGTQHSEEIPIGEPIVPRYNGSKVLPVAQLFNTSMTAGASPDVDEESSDILLEEIRASPPPFEYYHGEQLEDDPQLTAENMKKLQAVVREFTKFSVQMANRSYLKSQKLKATEVDRQKIALLEAENAALKKDKAALEQRVRMLKEVIQKNRGDPLS